MYLRFRQAIENVNVIIATYQDGSMGDVTLKPQQGNVAFGSGLHGWGFTVEHFGRLLAAKNGLEPSKVMEKLCRGCLAAVFSRLSAVEVGRLVLRRQEEGLDARVRGAAKGLLSVHHDAHHPAHQGYYGAGE